MKKNMVEQNKYVKCACCGSLEVPKGEEGLGYICFKCGQEKDRVQEDKPDYEGGANKMSLNQAKEAYKNGLPIK